MQIRILSFSFLFIFYSCSRQEYIRPERKNIVEAVYASGKIISENEYYLYSLSNGTVKEKHVEEGDLVKKDELLYVIRNDAPLARLEAARTGLDNAQQNLSPQSRVLNDLKLNMQSAQARFTNDSMQYSRLKNLLQQNATSQVNADNALTVYTLSFNQKKSAEERYYASLNELELALENAKSQLAAAQYDMNNHFIRSESNGTVFLTFKEPGESVRINEVVALIGKTSERIIRLAVDQQDIDKIKPDQEVLLKMDMSGSKVYHASITRIYPVMNEADQTFRVDAVFKDKIEFPYIHASVEANIIIQQKEHVMVIPRKALMPGDSVLVNKGGNNKPVYVRTGIQSLDDVEILSGLDESSEVILPAEK